jgi:hypothetical protein
MPIIGKCRKKHQSFRQSCCAGWGLSFEWASGRVGEWAGLRVCVCECVRA